MVEFFIGVMVGIIMMMIYGLYLAAKIENKNRNIEDLIILDL